MIRPIRSCRRQWAFPWLDAVLLASIASWQQAITITRLMNGNLRLSIPIPDGIKAAQWYEAAVWIKSRNRDPIYATAKGAESLPSASK